MKAPGARGRYGVFQTRLLVLLSNDDNHHLKLPDRSLPAGAGGPDRPLPGLRLML